MLERFNTFDIVMAVLIFLLMLRCAKRGFIGEVFSMGAWALGVLGGAEFYGTGAAWLRRAAAPLREVPLVPEVLAFVGIFVLIALVVNLLAGILKGAANALHMGALDRILGAGFGIIEGLALTGFIIFLFKIQPLFAPPAFIDNGFFGGLFNSAIPPIQRDKAVISLFLWGQRHV
jgi:membrane protein required for colicin V production